MTFIIKNSGFDLVYTLTPTQIANTITMHPGGIFFLKDNTDNINLGNNTIVQDDYNNINVSITNNIQLVFLNRFVPSLGPKELQIHFFEGSPNYYAYGISEIIPYQSNVLTSPYRKQNVQYNIIEKTTCFNFTYTLTDTQYANTKGLYPSGVFYLYDNTNSLSLGNNTLVQNDYNNINVNDNNKVLTFVNRVFSSLGTRQLYLLFWTGTSPLLVYSTQYTATALPFESTYAFTSRGPTFDLTYTLSPYQLSDTIGRFPNGIFYLNDVTDGLNLGNNTNVQSDFSNINISITNNNQLVFLNRTPPSLGIKKIQIQFYVGYSDGNIGIIISENMDFESIPLSNICFPSDTPILTDQGNIPIVDIQPGVHTLHQKKIVAITKTIPENKSLICFEKDALYPNVPSQRTLMSVAHCVFYKGKFIPAKYFKGMDGISEVDYRGPLYNVLMEDHDSMLVNSLICETLHPQNKIAKLFTGGSLEEYQLYYEAKKIEIEHYCKTHGLTHY